MSLANKKSGIEIPDRMRNKLEKFQKRVWLIKLAEGLLAAAFGLLVSYLLVFTLDRFFDTPAFLRTVILIFGALGLGIWFPMVCHKWIWKSRRLEQVAKLLKFKFPRLGDHLLGIIELVNNQEESSRSEALTRAALAQVDEETKNRDFSNAVPTPKHVQWGLIAGIPAVVAIAALVLVPAAGGNALMRWLMPWKHTERYTFAQIEELPESIVVPKAENSSLEAKLASETRWTPDSASAKVGKSKLTAKENSGEYGFKLPPLTEDANLNVSVGDVRETVKVQPMTRPELSSLIANIKLPDYLERTELVRKDIRGGVVSTVTGSEVSFIGIASREIEEATADGNPIKVIGNEMLTSAVNVDESKVMEFQWTDNVGLTSKKPLQLRIRSKADQEPSLYCPQLTKKKVIMEKDVLSFQVNASDDFGVKTIGMEWVGNVGRGVNYEASSGEKIVSAGSPESTEMDVVATFNPERLDVKPQVVNLRLFAEDYLPERKRVYSSTYTVYVLSEDEHAIWMTRKIEDWYKQSLETYEQEVINHDINKRLRELTNEELDQPENRKRIKTQAMAEQINTRRLEALTDTGAGLIKEAVRNDQFDANKLEKLSEMVLKLDEISDVHMPSVADLLQKGADAPTGPPQPGQPQSGQPQSGQPQSGQPGQPQPGQPQSGQPQSGQPQSGQPQNGPPQDGKPGEGESSEGPEAAPSVRDDKSSGAGGEGGPAPEGEQPPAAPSINIQESTMGEPEEGEEQEGEAPPSPTGPSALTLPTVTLQDNSAPPVQEPAEPSEASELVAQAVQAQEELLIEFQKVAEEMQQIVQNLEGSTFVKRLKAMARLHLELASDINGMTLGEFGNLEADVEKPTVERSRLLAERELHHGKTTSNIQEDLEAYVNRVNIAQYQTVLDEMKSYEVVEQLGAVSEKIAINETGGSIAHAELLADIFDRWAEELVPAAGEPGEPGEPGEGEAASLPPELILEIMKILEKEISLREETRSVQQAKPQLAEDKFAADAESLADTQNDLIERTEEVIASIMELENASAFSNEVGTLSAANLAMNDAFDSLLEPDTGAPAIAAETEAIEQLLAANRAPPSGGGGSGGTNPGDGDRFGVAVGGSPLALLGQSEQEDAKIEERTVIQATGKSGDEIAEEFQYGMDRYFQALEKSR